MIVIDQIGYRTSSPKFFIIKNPIIGYDSSITFVPGETVELRRSSDDSSVLKIPLLQWNNGQVDKTFSGDQVWQGDFTSVQTPGTYYIYEPKNKKRSYNFQIGDSIYNKILTAAVKSYFFQRSNIEISSRYGNQWTHALDHSQQKSAHLYDHSQGGDQGKKTARDVTGGWFDAGDYGKYTAYMGVIVWELAYAYEWYANGFVDNAGIPESGNGVPDILDEIKVELDWMLKMQRDDGALFSGCFPIKTRTRKTGEGDPSTDERPFGYANVSTAATSSGAIAFAIGARQFKNFEKEYPGYSSKLYKAAEEAWGFLSATPHNLRYDSTNFMKGSHVHENDEDRRLRVVAAAELFRLTSAEKYKTYFEKNYNNPDTASNGHQPIISNRFDPDQSLDLQRGLVSYCLSPNATPAVVNNIKRSLKNGVEAIVSKIDRCPYKAYIKPQYYHWGSNKARAGWANIIQFGIQLLVAPDRNEDYRHAAEEHLHYFHGRNATGYCYLTQSQLYGADKPITQLYHGWFHDKTKYDNNPAPGFLSGGPNRYFSPDKSFGKLVPPQEQPPMKSYKDWNTSWPENSWAVTENSTGYQSRYILLLAAFAGERHVQ